MYIVVLYILILNPSEEHVKNRRNTNTRGTAILLTTQIKKQETRLLTYV